VTNYHEVTVYDRVPATALVSVEQLESYMRRTGWSLDSVEEELGTVYWTRGDDRTLSHRGDDAFWLVEDIEFIALWERRLPSAVLADIAKEPT
jgi:hypothetical protein